MRQEHQRLAHEKAQMVDKIKENAAKVKQNKVLPYLVGNVVEVGIEATRVARRGRALTCRSLGQLLDVDNEGEEEGAVKNEHSAKKGKCAVIKTSSRQVCAVGEPSQPAGD